MVSLPLWPPAHAVMPTSVNIATIAITIVLMLHDPRPLISPMTSLLLQYRPQGAKHLYCT